MKNLFVFILLFSMTQLLAETATSGPEGSSAEKDRNNLLIKNSATAQKIQEANPVKTDLKVLSNKGSSTSAPSAANLTDQQKQLSENFIDQAGANKIIQEKCVGEMEQACAGNEVDHKVMGMNPGMMKAAAQAYATFGAMSDSFLPLSAGSGKMFGSEGDKAASTNGGEVPKTESDKVAKPASDKPAGDKPQAEQKEKPTDYCKYIPTVSEGYAAFAQKNTVDGLSNGGETSQKEQLLKAAKSHDGRAEQAQVQAIGWYGGAACYAVNAGMGTFAIDKNLIIKIAAATFLGTVYQSEVAANKEYAQKTRDIAESLPGVGDCNPVTENECYCATPAYANDPTHCKAQIAKRNAPSAFTRVACTDNTLKIDPSCACEKTNTCFDKFLENQGAANLQLGVGYGNSPFKSVGSLAKGKLEGGTLNGSAYAGTSAIAKKALKEFGSKIPGSNNPLNLNQKAVADAFTSKGIPASVARLMAQNSPPQSALNSAMAKTSGFSNGAYELASVSKNNVVDFSGGNGLGIGGRKNEKKNGVDDFLGKLNSGKTGAASNAKVLEFAQKAQAQAPQITKSDRPIFEIISLRYQTSGRRLLELDSNN